VELILVIFYFIFFYLTLGGQYDGCSSCNGLLELTVTGQNGGYNGIMEETVGISG